ncbi:type IV secretory pathway VirB10-like protein [Bradyrhizobium sp. USDA 4501]|nr:type IV secretory pathway VirB10-like protein [Bradyrhizobium elkanii]
MTSKAGIFFAGVGTTFIILGAGFGGGLFMANSALKDSAGAPARVSSPAPAEPARVILPSTAEAAQPPPPATQREPATPDAASPPQPPLEPVKDVQAPVEKQADVVDTRKSDIAEKERRKRYAERKAKRVATEQARRQPRRIEQGEQRREAPVLLEQARRHEVPIMASEDDDSPPRPFANFFRND